MLLITTIIWHLFINHRWNYVRDFFKRKIGDWIAAHDIKFKLGVGFVIYLVMSTIVWKVVCTVAGYVPVLGTALGVFCAISGLE